MSEICAGNVVLMKGFKRVAVTPIVEATFTHKADKGRYDVFLYLGSVTREGVETLDAEAILNEMGWRFDAEGAA